MNVVYSFYSAPYFGNPMANPGNWKRPGFEFVVWAWSVLQSRKWASNIQLVTDTFGAELFRKLQLPFDDVRIELDNIEPNGGKLWAIGKIKAYEIQTEPFIHLDGDAWFTNSPSQELFESPAACQSKEYICNAGYLDCLREVVQNTPATDPFRLLHQVGNRPPIAGCTSVYVCNDLDFNQRYCEAARGIYERYVALKSGDFVSLSEWNMFVEQLVFGEVYFQTFGREPTYLLDATELKASANRAGFCHVWGNKKNKRCSKWGARLKAEHPDVYRHIITTLKEFSLAGA